MTLSCYAGFGFFNLFHKNLVLRHQLLVVLICVSNSAFELVGLCLQPLLILPYDAAVLSKLVQLFIFRSEFSVLSCDRYLLLFKIGVKIGGISYLSLVVDLGELPVGPQPSTASLHLHKLSSVLQKTHG